MEMVCPHCNVNGIVDDSLVGRRVKCPKCTNIFVINPGESSVIELDALDIEEYNPNETSQETQDVTGTIEDLDISDLLREEADQDEFPSETCEACGKQVHSALLMEIDSKKYCASCVPDHAFSSESYDEGEPGVNAASSAAPDTEAETVGSIDDEFSAPIADMEMSASPPPKQEVKEEKKGTSTTLKILLLFLVVVLGVAGAVFYLDIKLF